jgi:DNA-binding IclR family transcriptional regulator
MPAEIGAEFCSGSNYFAMKTASEPARIRDERAGRSATNRSLERGVEILRAFRPGSELLGNGEIAERTGLSRSTISRLTQTLVGCGLLQLDAAERAYRLAPPILSLAHAMRSGSRVLAAAAPHMRTLAERRRVNVGLAAPDRDSMVYLESIRYARRVALREVVSGQRVPMELTSLGRAYLAVTKPARRRALLEVFARHRNKQWAGISLEIEKARLDVLRSGYCGAAWQPEVVALSAPLIADEAVYVLNVSLSTKESIANVAIDLAPDLLRLVDTVRKELSKQQPRTL